jgi:ubiquitin fusion degradation protein 1
MTQTVEFSLGKTCHCFPCSLETTLRSFSCLTTGDNIMMAYNNKKYYINIVEAKPGPAISIIETDCEVDFAPPLDYKEPERVPRAPPVVEPKASAPKAGESCAHVCIAEGI